MNDYPKVSVWITSTGRYDFLQATLGGFLKYNTYPNIEFLVFESIPTKESLKYFNTPSMRTQACIDYVKSLKLSNLIHWVEEWPPWGSILQKFLDYTDAPYAIQLDDDCQCVTDPKTQWIDGIELLKQDQNLLGFRNDLSDDTVTENDTRFNGVKRNTISDYLYWPVHGGICFIDVARLHTLGGFVSDHALPEYIQVEQGINKLLRDNAMYIGVMLKYYGSFAHIGHTEVTGRDRRWSKDFYMSLVNRKFFGVRSARKE